MIPQYTLSKWIAMSSIGGLNFPAVWGWPLVAPGNQRI